ncbi:uncharacterized protein MONOS_14634 [Monocercomonoides exilis]|uniref:uncharacterized protein n=1 Tax=Monocercomonoides exilis TaxID=2049356 RepID=UPI0035594101|nr:hypothetical protein MONOS_14634 [Monocercomonoides exilis]|eukprot:MONOS_14634.1-p1 / transcript=MONOS_14634.1 / gene=MONOS_14634 / organism=Monocercomonoides_exilis_PA203 / gene_product=unspecified product / transcript_product=unspecified product / location=Mono_scaffold01038:5501-9573(+) / protein_length=1004 / sequence_SO=supercontig / SO=protein_coding / is_pseudo=false
MCSLECHSSLEGAEGAAMKIQGVTNFKLMKFVIPSSFSSGVNVLMHVGSNEGLLTVKDCSFTKKGDEREELTDYGLIKAEEGTVVLEFVSMQSLCFSQDVISVLSTTILNLKNLTMKNLELNGSSGLSVSKSSGREKNEVEQDVVIEWSIFEEVTQNTTNDIPIIRNDNDNQLKILIRNTTMKRCGGLKCEKGGGMFYALNEGGSLDCSFCTISECFCSTKGRGGWLFLECASVVEQPLNFVLSNITFKDNSALRGRDVFVKCTDLDSQISESQFLINFGEPFAKDLAIWGCTADNYGDEEDLLGRVYVFRSEFIFVSSIVGNSSNSKNCGEMKSACSSLNTGVSHVIPSDYSQLYIWNETTLTGSCSAQKVTIKSMESNRNAEIKVNEIDFADEGAVTTSESVRFEKVSFVFGGMQNVVCSCLIHQLNGSLILESVLFLSENRTTEDSQILFDFSLIVVEEGLFEAEKCNVGHLKFSKPVFNILHSERATFDDVGMDDVECKSSAIECGKSEKLSVSKLAVTNIDLEERSLISLENSHSSLVLSLELSSFTNISQSTSGSCIVCTTHPMSGFGMCNCSFHECTSKLKKGSQVETTSVEKILIESKDPKAFEMVTMEMSPEEQWRRAEREAEKKNEERIKKRVYDKTLEHSESSEHLLSESGSTEYILGRDSDKIPEWALEKEEVEEIRKRTPSPSISSTSTTSTTDSDSTFVRMEDMCPTTSSMSNLVDAMACSSPHEKLIVDLRDSLFMLLHGRNEKKEMAIGSLKEREQTAAQILFWVANLALHSFDEMENPLQSLANLSPHIVLFSEHMVICVVMHSDFISSDDSDSSSISSSTVVTSASDDDDSDSLPSSAFEDEDDYKKECLRWMAPELLMNRKMGATKKSVVFSIGMMLWECLTLEIPFGEYPAEVAGQKIANGERPDFLKTEGRNQGGLIIACTRTESEDRISLGDVKRELIGNFPPGAAMLTMTDALGLIQESECNERESNEIGTEDEFENMKIE